MAEIPISGVTDAVATLTDIMSVFIRNTKEKAKDYATVFPIGDAGFSDYFFLVSSLVAANAALRARLGDPAQQNAALLEIFKIAEERTRSEWPEPRVLLDAPKLANVVLAGADAYAKLADAKPAAAVADIQALKNALAEEKAKAEELRNEATQAKLEIRAKMEDLTRFRAESERLLADANAKAAQSTAELEKAKNAGIAMDGELAAAKQAFKEAEAASKRFGEEAAALKQEHEKRVAELKELQQRYGEAVTTIQELRKQVEELQNDLKTTTTQAIACKAAQAAEAAKVVPPPQTQPAAAAQAAEVAKVVPPPQKQPAAAVTPPQQPSSTASAPTKLSEKEKNEKLQEFISFVREKLGWQPGNKTGPNEDQVELLGGNGATGILGVLRHIRDDPPRTPLAADNQYLANHVKTIVGNAKRAKKAEYKAFLKTIADKAAELWTIYDVMPEPVASEFLDGIDIAGDATTVVDFLTAVAAPCDKASAAPVAKVMAVPVPAYSRIGGVPPTIRVDAQPPSR